ncbi:acyl-CoA desaturase [Actinoalloteichus fjordicus]|uniref:Fatty-acid desaturase n=1 Tax=Actinoalloteichus fjordicus TaxID=1612552 RepID=A0AAC9L9A8_9PSEU|nr:fatty-acid desaturase [Actinoalloteichus fjordicus]
MTVSTRRVARPASAPSRKAPAGAESPAGHPELEPASGLMRALLVGYVGLPLAALLVAVPLAWAWGLLSWVDVGIFLVMYLVSGLGITVGFHRYFTHGSFRARRPLRIALAVAGSLAIEMSVTDWVATHRKHHQFADQVGDPHSPWRFGTGARALTKGLLFAHVGWLFTTERGDRERYARDLVDDADINRVNRLFPVWALTSVFLPALVGGLITWSWQGALTAFFWGSLVRIGLLQHVTWSVNSICHVFGDETFTVRDRSRNVWWLAVISFGESWHNLHHSDPTCARHGVLRGQLDPSARVIRWFEQAGWAHDVRWPNPSRLAARRIA